MLLDTSREKNLTLQQHQLKVQQQMQQEALSEKANTAFEIGPQEQQPVHLLPVFAPMSQQQQVGAILNLTDAEREEIRQHQYEAQKAAVQNNDHHYQVA